LVHLAPFLPCAEAARQNGVALIDFTNGSTTGDVQTTGYENWDVIDVCSLSPAAPSLALAAVGRDGTIGLFRNAMTEQKPFTMKVSGIKGNALRVLPLNGHLVLLTSEALYLLGDVASECVRGRLTKDAPTPVVGMPLKGSDASAYRDRSVLVVDNRHEVLRVNLALLGQALPNLAEHSVILRSSAVLANPPFTTREFGQELQAK
jgi:hypothetical protein